MASKTDPYSKKVTEQFVKFESVGDEVHGRLVQVGRAMMPGGEVGRYVVENESGRYAFLGSVGIDNHLTGKRIGYDFKLVYTGEITTGGGRPLKQFDLFERS